MRNCIKVERAKYNLTQEELARAVNVSRQTINSIESQNYQPSAVLALVIARYFNKPFDEIFQLDEDELENIPPLPPSNFNHT